MKKMMIALIAILMVAASGKAMSYEQARNEALFLTDKMAYELNLTDEQYEAAYEINLDYLMGVTSYDDVYATYWERRNLDMSYVLLDWQWNAFCAATYFYRPLYWEAGYWHFGIYARYPHRDYFYFGRPVFYASYRGGHAWHCVGGRGYYYERRVYFHSTGRSHYGMLDRWKRGDYRHHHSGRYSSYGGNRISSTRTTVHNNSSLGNRRSYTSDRNFGKNRYSSSEARHHERYSGSSSYGGRNSSSSYGSRSNNYNRNSGSSYNGRNYGSSASLGGRISSSSSGSFSGRSSNSSYRGRSHSSGSFSGSYSSGSSYGGSRSSSGSFGGSRSSGSFSSGGRRSSGGQSASGGRSFGGRR